MARHLFSLRTKKIYISKISCCCLGFANGMTFYERTEIRHFISEIRTQNEKDTIFTLSLNVRIEMTRRFFFLTHKKIYLSKISSFCLGFANCMTFYERTEIRHFISEIRTQNEKDAMFTLSLKDFVYA